MIRFSEGNILLSQAEAIVNTVNCVGVMGKGLALQIKKAYPDNFAAYKKACDQGKLVVGEMFVFDNGTLFPPRYIINFPTKEHWRCPSKLEYIITGVKSLCNVIRRLDISSIAVPPLGCGNGNLCWSEVLPVIETGFSNLNGVDVFVYAPAQ